MKVDKIVEEILNNEDDYVVNSPNNLQENSAISESGKFRKYLCKWYFQPHITPTKNTYLMNQIYKNVVEDQVEKQVTAYAILVYMWRKSSVYRDEIQYIHRLT